jgi:hypothetical protein
MGTPVEGGAPWPGGNERLPEGQLDARFARRQSEARLPKGVFMKKYLVAALLAAVPASAWAAEPATSVTSRDPNSIVSHLQDRGYRAKVTKDDDGDPMIETATGGTTFYIQFYECEDHKSCENLQFSVAYDTDDGKGPTLDKINEWNRDNRFGQAYLDTVKDPAMDMQVWLIDGSLPVATFEEYLDTWADTVDRFEKHIGW